MKNTHTSSRTMKRKLLTIKGHLRPYRSAAIPKMTDPTDRNMRTRVIPQVISVLVLPNVSARSSTVNETVKKSNASHVYNTLSVSFAFPSQVSVASR